MYLQKRGIYEEFYTDYPVVEETAKAAYKFAKKRKELILKIEF